MSLPVVFQCPSHHFAPDSHHVWWILVLPHSFMAKISSHAPCREKTKLFFLHRSVHLFLFVFSFIVWIQRTGGGERYSLLVLFLLHGLLQSINCDQTVSPQCSDCFTSLRLQNDSSLNEWGWNQLKLKFYFTLSQKEKIPRIILPGGNFKLKVDLDLDVVAVAYWARFKMGLCCMQWFESGSQKAIF